MAVTPISVSPSLASVLNAAGDRNDVDFDYLLQTAMRESSLNPNAKAATSSATGLFQFLDTTWLEVMKQEGPRLGYQKYADAITEDANGDYVIKDPKLRAAVLKLRENPQVAADMAAAFTKANGDYLKSKFGRMPSPGELYIAHFLGPQGAEKMFNAGLKNPDQIAATLFPHEAAANPTIFYDHGQARSIRQVYKALVAQTTGGPGLDPGYAAQQLAQQQVATAAPQPLPRPAYLPAAPQVATAQPVPLAPLPASNDGPPTQDPLPIAPAASVPQLPPVSPAIAAEIAPLPAYQVVTTAGVGAAPPDSLGHSRPVTGTAADAPEVPSRFGPGSVNFTTLFSDEGLPADGGTAPMQPGQGAFFTQLYSQH